MPDKNVEQPTQVPPGEKHFGDIDDLELTFDDFTFQELVEKGELTSVDFDQPFLEKLLGDIRKSRQSVLPEDIRMAGDIDLTDLNKKKIDLTEKNAGTTYRFLSAVSDLDFLVNLTEEEESELQIVPGNSREGHTVSRITGYGQKEGVLKIPIDQDDKNLYIQQWPIEQENRSVDDPLSYLEQRMDIVIDYLYKVVKGIKLQKSSHADQVNFAIEWAVLRTVYAGNRLGIFPVKPVEK